MSSFRKRLLSFSTVRARLTLWFLVLAALPMVVVTLTLYVYGASALKEGEVGKLKAVRELKIRELNLWLDERIGDVTAAASDFEIRGLESEDGLVSSITGDKKRRQVARGLFRRYIRIYRTYLEIFIVDAKTGRVSISSTTATEGRLKSGNPLLTEPMRTGKLFIKDIYFSSSTGKPTMTFSRPVRCLAHSGSHVIGVLVARVHLETTLFAVLANRTGLGATGETLIINKHGLALNELRWRERAPLRLKITARPAVLAVQGKTGVIEINDYRNKRVVAAYGHIQRMGWGFVAKRDLDEIQGPIQKLFWQLMAIMALILVGVFVLASRLGRSITQPVEEITAVAAKIQRGDLEARIRTDRDDELGMMANSLDDMAESIGKLLRIRGGLSALGEGLLAAPNMKTFSDELLKQLVRQTGAQMGAVYLRASGSGGLFELAVSVGLAAEALEPFSAELREGELGRALATGELLYLTHADDGARPRFRTVYGETEPQEIITLPIQARDEIVAVVSLGIVDRFRPEDLEYLRQGRLMLSAALSNMLVTEQTRGQAEELTEQTTELQAQRRRLEQADRLKSEFLSNMSHELRTPLNSILSLSQLLVTRAALPKSPKDTKHLQVIERSGRHLLTLVNNILDLSKIEAGHVELEIAPLKPQQLADRVLTVIRPLAEERGLELDARIGDLPIMESDELRLEQVLINLLSNAVKFTEEGKVTLVMTTTPQRDRVRFAVSDTGIGIPAEAQTRIFEPFRQFDGSTTRKYGGTGLGLAVTSSLVKMLNGAIVLESVPGRGSTFTVTLPTTAPTNGAALGVNGERSLPRRTSTPNGPLPTPHVRPSRILVVDDNEAAVLQIQAALIERGHSVSVVNSGAKALAEVARRKPDLIILDVMMPDMDGFEVLVKLRDQPEFSDMPVLVLTAKELTRAERQKLRSNNVRELIQKGAVNREHLLAAVEALLPTQAESAESPSTKEPSIRSGEPGKPGAPILVVEDDPNSLIAMEAILTELGWEVVVATDGPEAVAKAQECLPVAIFMDMQLPKLTGIEAMHRIRALPGLAQVPIVAVTAQAMKGDRERILEQGCDDYLAKPISVEGVVKILKKWGGSP